MSKEDDLLLAAFDSISKRYGKGSVFVGDNIIETERLGTGSISLDIVTGGGYGKGRIIELIGMESSGKTTIALHAIIEAQKAEPNKRVAFIDVEHAFDRKYAEALGVDMENIIISQPDYAEQALDIAETLIKTGKISVCVIDSVAALVPKAEMEGEMEDQQMGLQARLMSKAMRKLTPIVGASDTVLIMINQYREKIGIAYGSPKVASGGNALKFYASIRIEVSRKAGDKDSDGNIINNRVTCKTIKNKLAPPFRECSFDINFGEGIDRVGEVLDISVESGIVKKAGSWFSYGETKLGQGRVAVVELLRDNEELVEELTKKIKEVWI